MGKRRLGHFSDTGYDGIFLAARSVLDAARIMYKLNFIFRSGFYSLTFL